MAREERVQPLLITHELSNIGKIDITLHGLAATFYTQLDADGLIDYLKRLDHLGFIAKSHPGNHHKRWDYVCLQLYLLQKLKHSKFNTGLTKDTHILGEKASNQEILQTFILFANIGHLEGTLSSEKGLFDFLEQNSKAKADFLHNITKDDELSTLADKILRTYDFYKIKYLIALNYVLGSETAPRILAAIKTILAKYVNNDDGKFDRLRNLYFKVRKVAFLYLDSFHCRTPLQLNLTKILVNIFSFDTLFNPVDTDYDSVFEACETVLSKELYLSPKACLTHSIASKKFRDHLIANSKIEMSPFLIRLLQHKTPYVSPFPSFDDYHIFQFYFEESALRLLGAKARSTVEDESLLLHKRESDLSRVLNQGLTPKVHKVTIQRDMRKQLLFVTVLLSKSPNQKDAVRTLQNFNRLFYEVLRNFNNDLSHWPFVAEHARAIVNRSRKDVTRRYFLYVLKYLFEGKHRINAFISFSYRQAIFRSEIENPINPIIETGFAEDKATLVSDLDKALEFDIPKDIRNNIQMLKEIAINHARAKRQTRYFYSIFPIEMEEMVYSAEELDKSGNAESRTTITDIDGMLVVFQASSYELFLLEGKRQRKGFRTACKKDLNSIRQLSRFTEKFSDAVFINTPACKGGFLRLPEKSK